MPLRLALLALVLTACGAITPRQGTGGAAPDASRRADLGVIAGPGIDDDQDGDGFSPAQGDCDDNDSSINPMAREPCDGQDHNCDGAPSPTCDFDADGYTPEQGDCADGDKLANPGAMEVAGDKVDNDCNGMTDEATPTCDGNPMNHAMGLAGALGLCQPWVQSAKLNSRAQALARSVKTRFGDTYTPRQGATFTVLSTGIAADARDPDYNKTKGVQPGTDFGYEVANPAPTPNNNSCYKGPDATTVNDYVELTLTLKVPSNARSFSFEFTFLSAEYPEYVGTDFNDKFLAVLDSKSFRGNISFDAAGHPITVNAGFFDVCDSALICKGKVMNTCTKPVAELTGTGFEEQRGGRTVGGGTGWLKTTSPVTPGETATLRFMIFDEGDGILDSTVVIDNFRWQLEESKGPTTVG